MRICNIRNNVCYYDVIHKMYVGSRLYIIKWIVYLNTDFNYPTSDTLLRLSNLVNFLKGFTTIFKYSVLPYTYKENEVKDRFNL